MTKYYRGKGFRSKYKPWKRRTKPTEVEVRLLDPTYRKGYAEAFTAFESLELLNTSRSEHRSERYTRNCFQKGPLKLILEHRLRHFDLGVSAQEMWENFPWRAKTPDLLDDLSPIVDNIDYAERILCLMQTALMTMAPRPKGWPFKDALLDLQRTVHRFCHSSTHDQRKWFFDIWDLQYKTAYFNAKVFLRAGYKFTTHFNGKRDHLIPELSRGTNENSV